MIQIDNVRHNGMRHEWKNMKPAHVAFDDMVRFELGYGGQVIALEQAKVTIRTCIMSCVDETTFSGSEQDMAPLIEVAALWLRIRADAGLQDRLLSRVADDLMRVEPGRDGVRPIIAKLAGPMFIGGRSTSALVKAAVHALLIQEGCEPQVPDLPLDDMTSVLFMALSGEMKISDALTAVA
jgi:hypothetical protein